MAEKIYVTDKAEIRKLLNESVSKNGKPEIKYFPAEELFSDKLMKNPDFKELAKRIAGNTVIICNAFTPTKEGQERFSYLAEKLGTDDATIYTIPLQWGDFTGYIKYQPQSAKDREEKELRNWLRQSINDAISKSMPELGIPYDCFLFPLYEEIEKQRRALNDSAKCKSRVEISLGMGDFVFCGKLCDREGKILKIPPGEIPLEKLKKFKNGTIIEVEREPVEQLPPPLYNYMDLLEELAETPIKIADGTKFLYELYMDKKISFPETAERHLDVHLQDKFLTPNELNFPPYEDYAKAFRFRKATGYKNSAFSGGISLISQGIKKDYMEAGNAAIKELYDLLLCRQLMQFAPAYQGEKVRFLVEFDVLEDYRFYVAVNGETTVNGGWKALSDEVLSEERINVALHQEAKILDAKCVLEIPKLHNAKSLIQLLKLHAAGTPEEITQIIHALERSAVEKYGNYYLLHDCDRKMLSNLPKELKSMNIYGKLHQSCKRAVRDRVSREDYERMVSEELADYCEKLKKEMRKT